MLEDIKVQVAYPGITVKVFENTTTRADFKDISEKYMFSTMNVDETEDDATITIRFKRKNKVEVKKKDA